MASKPPRPPDAFLSYTRFDDRRERGKISQFRQELEDEVRAVTGEAFEIFQDVDDIDVGERWSDKLDQMLDDARFFIPILTPNYFGSKACRDELGKFLKAEKAKGRGDLVLPVYYIEWDILEDAELRITDPLAMEIHQRQHHDWRKLRHSSFSTKAVKIALHNLARAIGKARRRTISQRSEGDDAPSAHQAALTVPRPTETRVRDTPAQSDSTSLSQPKTRQSATVFRDVDAPWCPEMVVISTGEFMMGSTDAERQWAVDRGAEPEWVGNEKPQHLVRLAHSLAIGRFPVTFEQYDRFARITGRDQPGDAGWGRGRRPVINVSWEDSKAYVDWLAAETGKPYRLLSEAEWEYACRAGTTTRYWWGDEITPENANYGSNVNRTSEVGGYPANPFGLCDMNGNVWEWVEDCWNDSYEGAPDDGSAWARGDCGRRVLRGGTWKNEIWKLRSANRFGVRAGEWKDDFGLRVAKTLTS